ncbi:MAG: hypothetical protein ABXS93_06820 [Sulfurimonas sp.]
MKKIYTLLVLFFGIALSAEKTTVTLSYDNFTFDNSKQKYEGQRFSTYGAFEASGKKIEALYERAVTQTYQPPLDADLKVNKYYLKYKHSLNKNNALLFEYIYVDDSIMQGGVNKYGKLLPKLDNTNIYALGYKYKDLQLIEYFSDYANFNVYQSDLKYKIEKKFEGFSANMILLGKHIYIDNKENEPALKNADKNYYTAGVKVHAEFGSYHFGAATLLGKRLFGIMFDGFRVQHHPMEIDRTYMAGVTKHFENFALQAKYVYQRAKEVPLNNENVIIKNIIFNVSYHF